jgi:hypothetical protein
MWVVQHAKVLKEEEAKGLERIAHATRLHEKELSLREQKVLAYTCLLVRLRSAWPPLTHGFLLSLCVCLCLV